MEFKPFEDEVLSRLDTFIDNMPTDEQSLRIISQLDDIKELLAKNIEYQHQTMTFFTYLGLSILFFIVVGVMLNAVRKRT